MQRCTWIVCPFTMFSIVLQIPWYWAISLEQGEVICRRGKGGMLDATAKRAKVDGIHESVDTARILCSVLRSRSNESLVFNRSRTRCVTNKELWPIFDHDHEFGKKLVRTVVTTGRVEKKGMSAV